MTDQPGQHGVKISPIYFDAVADGRKPFEVRRNDRCYQTGDLLILSEWDKNTTTGWTGRELIRRITYVLPGGQHGIDPGYCVLGLADDA